MADMEIKIDTENAEKNLNKIIYLLKEMQKVTHPKWYQFKKTTINIYFEKDDFNIDFQ